MSTPVIILNSSPATCGPEPMPADAMLILPGLALAGIKSYSGFVDHHRVVSKSHILECVGNNHGFTAIDDVSAKGGVTRRLLGIKPRARFEPLSVFIN